VELPALLGDHPDHANALTLLGQIAAAQGDAEAATAHLRAALAIHDLYLDDPESAEIVRPLRAEVLAQLGDARQRAGDPTEADALTEEALSEAEDAYGLDAAALARFHNIRGVVLRFAGRYAEAEAAYLRAAALRDAHGEPHPSTHFHNLSGLASARGDYAAAEAHARAAIDLSRAAGNSVTLGTDLCGLGDALVGQERLVEAEAAHRAGLAHFATSTLPDHPEVAYTLHNLGDCLVALGRFEDAEAAYHASITRKREAFGDSHPEIAATLSNLAALHADLGRLTEATARSAEAVAMVRPLPANAPIRVGVEALAARLGVG
jgi:tetratricopeptide (TPR) repeat protein